MSWIGYRLGQSTFTPTITAGAYDADDCIGGLQTTSATSASNIEAGTGAVIGAILTDKASQIGTHAIEAYLFDDNPSASTFTDNAAFNINDADVLKCFAVIRFAEDAGGVIGSSSANHVITMPRSRCEHTYQLATLNSKIYIALKIKGAATFASTSDIQLRLHWWRF